MAFKNVKTALNHSGEMNHNPTERIELDGFNPSRR